MIAPLTRVNTNAHQYTGGDVEQCKGSHEPNGRVLPVLRWHPRFYSEPNEHKGGYHARKQMPALRTGAGSEKDQVHRRNLDSHHHDRQIDAGPCSNVVLLEKPPHHTKDDTDTEHKDRECPPWWWPITHPPDRKPPTLVRRLARPRERAMPRLREVACVAAGTPPNQQGSHSPSAEHEDQ